MKALLFVSHALLAMVLGAKKCKSSVSETLEAAAGELGLKQLTGTAMEKASRILDELGC